MRALIVTQDFGGHEKGTQIEDADAIAHAELHHADKVVAINIPDPPKSKKTKDETAA